MITIAKYYFFRCLQRVAAMIGRASLEQTRLGSKPESTSSEQRYLWVFASTIGELHSIQPFLEETLELTSLSLFLLTDRPHYLQAYKELYPDAVVAFHGDEGQVSELITIAPPELMLLAEIPCHLSDAPCRFSYSVLFKLKQRNVPVVLVNGWLYGQKPSCRIDEFEYRLLNRDFIKAIDLFCLQTQAVADRLISLGASPDQVHVTGNTKFDRLNSPSSLNDLEVNAGLKEFMVSLEALNKPTLVAGCVTNFDEQACLLDAYCELIEAGFELVMVIAPRYPEKQDRMKELYKMLEERQITYVKRTEFDSDLSSRTGVVVLDSIGELKHLYRLSTISFVGRNHNVLEPLAFNKPVIVSNGWDSTYPSYPVYESTRDAGVINEISNAAELKRCISDQLEDPCGKDKKLKLDQLTGAGARNICLMKAKGYFSSGIV